LVNSNTSFALRPIGVVRSPLKSKDQCPSQGREGGAEAVVEIFTDFVRGAEDISSGREIVIITWLDRAGRDALAVHPRGNPANPLTGVFSTRSPNRPNPIGLHRVQVLEITGGNRIRVRPLEALDGTPVVDIKPVLARADDA
jgi:tRNA-Thr(GGU) m(6)t(6)A37 methyltransferase TsaA